jgi:hypothetical protein
MKLHFEKSQSLPRPRGEGFRDKLLQFFWAGAVWPGFAAPIECKRARRRADRRLWLFPPPARFLKIGESCRAIES